MVLSRLISMHGVKDIPGAYRNTPIGDFIANHNLDAPYRNYSRAEIPIGMCMDNRKVLRIPDNFAYILRTGGANLKRVEFKVSYAIAVGGGKLNRRLPLGRAGDDAYLVRSILRDG